MQQDTTRLLHVHRDVPGVLSRINEVFSRHALEIAGQHLQTDGTIGCVVVDVAGRPVAGAAIRDEPRAIDGTLRVRFLY